MVLKNLEKYEYLLQQNDLRGASGALNDIAFVFWNNNHYKEAAHYYEKSLVLNEKVANENGIAMINNNLGMLYADLEQYNKSLDSFTKTLAARRANKEPIGIISALINMSVVLNNLERYGESISRLLEALDIARELYDKQQMRSVYGMLSETYEKKGDVEKSLQYFELYKSFHEQIQREEISEVNEQLEQERMEKQTLRAEQIAKENELLKKQLEIYEQEKELLAKDSINRSLYSNLSRKEVEIELLQRDRELSEMTNAAQTAENLKLQNEKSYLRNLLILIVLAMLIIIVLVVINIRRSRNYTRALQVKNEAIEKHRKELETANQTKDRIFSIISHDLRSPIASLQGFFLLLEDIEMPHELKNALESVEGQLTNNASLLDNLLNWSRLELANEPPRTEEIHITELVENTFRLLQNQASNKGVKLISNVSKKDTLVSDYKSVDIVLRNLVQNAVKFTPQGGNVSVAFTKGKDVSILEVKDTGIGMDEQKVASLFDITTNRSSKGTDEETGSGLGLILSKELIEKIGGLIEVSSEPGEGSVFSIKFSRY